jgi:hypothetical protein
MKEFGDFQHSNIPATITKARPIDNAALLLTDHHPVCAITLTLSNIVNI